jgi:hypothetical protein
MQIHHLRQLPLHWLMAKLQVLAVNFSVDINFDFSSSG